MPISLGQVCIQLKARLGSKIHKKKLRNVGGRNARTEVGKLEKFWLGEDRHLFWSDTMGWNNLWRTIHISSHPCFKDTVSSVCTLLLNRPHIQLVQAVSYCKKGHLNSILVGSNRMPLLNNNMEKDTDIETDKCIYKTLGGCVTPAGF